MGRPSKITPRLDRKILNCVKKNPKISAPRVLQEINNINDCHISVSTVRNVLRSNDYHGRTARKKYWVNDINRKKRLEFAKKYINEKNHFWQTVIYSDESKYNIFKSDGHHMVWRKPNMEYKKENLCPTVKHGGGSVFVWGCMSAFGVGKLAFIDGIRDHKTYINILKENLLSSAAQMGFNNNWIFLQDNDPKHKAWNTKAWILFNAPKYLEIPPQSPDINIIEHVWDYLDNKIRNRPISSKETLKIALREEWALIPSSYIFKLVDSMPQRLQAIINANGGPTKY